MSLLIPLEFSQLGLAEFVWLLLALLGLSLAAGGRRHRLRPAILTALLVATGGVLRKLGGGAGPGAWELVGPTLVVPGAAYLVVRAGALRPRLEALAGGAGRLGAAWTLLLVVWSVVARPWGLGAGALPEWAFLAAYGVVTCALLASDGAVSRTLGRKAGPFRGWTWLGAAFVGLCAWTAPFGSGLLAAFAQLFLVWLAYAVVEQGREMRRYVARRLLGAPFVLLILMVLSFVMIRLAPGGPFAKEKSVAPEIQEAVRSYYGLDQPVPVQFKRYIGNVAWKGDLGLSYKQLGWKVNRIIADHATPSAQLGLAAIALALLIGITAGLISGIRRNSIFDYTSMAAAMLGLALPTFIVGPMLVLAFSLKLDWFNVSGWDLAHSPKDIVLPAITLSLPFAARIARLTRAGMLEIVNQDYIRTARAKGLSEPVIVIRHTLKGTLLPVVSFLGPAIAQLLTGSLVVEKIFSVPGLGYEFVNSALNRDYPLAMGLVILFGSLLIAFNLIVDIAYAFLDPRIRHG